METDIIVLGINHRTAPVEVREKLSFTEKEMDQVLSISGETEELEEVVIISTCNRTEIYCAGPRLKKIDEAVVSFLAGFKGIQEDNIKKCLYLYRGREAVEHLFRVAAGLDSMVLGETQVLGQVKEAYVKSMEKQRVDTIFHALFRQALAVGKRVHRETAINDHPASVSYVAVNLAKQIFPVLQNQKVMVVGAGEMAQLTIKHLCDEGVKDLVIVNRSSQQAVRLVEMFGGRVEEYNHLLDIMPEADIVISSTSAPHFILNQKKLLQVMEKRNCKKIFLIDIAVPRDINPDVREVPGVHLYNIDDLQAVLQANMRERKLAAKKAEKVICQETKDFQDWVNTRMVVPLITAFRARAEEIRVDQLESSLEKLKGLSDKEKKVVERLTKNIVNDMLRIPVLRLKEKAAEKQAEECISSLCELFNLDINGEADLEKEKKSDRGR